ncbi:MAG TPA: hypothetical protein VGJ70_14595 [Solirubrobacteraceae bacterium]
MRAVRASLGGTVNDDGGLYFGATGDRDHAPDLDILTAGIEAGLGELLARA